jgi:hypothetical protein
VRLAPLFQDFQDKPLFQFHAGRAEKRSDASGSTPLLSDNLAKVIGRNPQFQDSGLLSFNFGDRNLLGVIHKRFRNHFYQIFHIRLSSETTLNRTTRELNRTRARRWKRAAANRRRRMAVGQLFSEGNSPYLKVERRTPANDELYPFSTQLREDLSWDCNAQ